MITIQDSQKLIDTITIMGIDSVEPDQLISLLELADHRYFNEDDPILSDQEYDTYYRYATNAYPTHVYFLGIGSSSRGNKVKLPYQMGSLDQKYEGEMLPWVSKNNLSTEKAIASNKLDGASAMVVFDLTGNFQIAYSRGDGIEGADISRHLRLIPSFPENISYDKPFTVRGELIISKVNFKRHIQPNIKSRSGQPYKNARNCISGLMNAESNPDWVYQYIDFVSYEIVDSDLSKTQQLELLKSLGFKVVKYQPVMFSLLTDAYLKLLVETARENSDYEIDGIVIDVDSAETRADMNPTRTTLNPAYSIKFKVADESNVAIATLVDVEINISKHGYLKPRVQIEPVELVGVTVTWATGFNMKFIHDNKIGPGSKIKITRSGDVIPFIVSVVEPLDPTKFHDWFQHKTNQFGPVTWTDTGVDLVLTNINDNDTVKLEQLIDFFDSIDAPHLGEGNLQKIFDMGFETPESIIELTQEDLGCVLNSTVNGKKIFKGLRDKLTNIPMYKLMGAHPAFGRGIGVRKMKKLYDAFSGNMESCKFTDAITRVEGFEIKTANKIKTGYPIFLEFLEKIRSYVTIQEYVAPVEGSLTGTTVVFTGFRNSALEQLVIAAGGKMGSGVSSKTGIVVAADPSSSSGKLDKARSLGVQVISIEQLKDML